MQHIHFKRILVPTDFSETARKAMEHVKWLAKHFSSEVTLMHVGELMPASSIFPSIYVPELEANAKYNQLILEKLEEWKQELLKNGIQTVHIQYSEGNVASCINDYATQEKMDIVVMGTHGSKGITEFFIGSNAFKLVNLIDLPVLTINNKKDFTPYKRIIAPLDNSKFSRAKFPYIAELAAILSAEVEILCPVVSAPDVKNAISICYDQVTHFLRKRGVKHSLKSIEGNFAHETIKYAEYVKADLIVIMSETETTISQMLLGSSAQEVVNHSVVPVITLHPEDKGDLMDIVIMPGT